MAMADFPQNTGSAFNAFQALNAARNDQNVRQAFRAGETAKDVVNISYKIVLENIQDRISNTEEYNKILAKALDSDEGYDQLKNIIYALLQRYNPPLPPDVIENFRHRIFQDMTGLGILTQYMEDPDVEEINIYGPGFKQIEIISSSKGKYRLPDEGFPDADAVKNIIKRMVRQGNMVIDQANPRVDSYMGPGVRISAMIPPVVREDKGAVASIRKQTKSSINKEMLLRAKTATEEELEFLDLCMQNKVSGAVVGATGSGKTTLLNYLMTNYVNAEQEEARVYIIEESRELQLPDDAKVFYTAVCGEEGKAGYVTSTDLLKSALRFHPTYISCAEMRGEEAMNAMMAAQTGHIVWSTFHADDGEAAYQRLLTMCKLSGTDLSEHLLMSNLVTAFPIIVSSQQMKDGSRKITGIFEAEGVDGVRVVGHYIYRMFITGYEYNDEGKVKHVRGYHCRVGDLSDRMAQKIYDNCGKLELVKKFARKDWLPESMCLEGKMHANVKPEDMF